MNGGTNILAVEADSGVVITDAGNNGGNVPHACIRRSNSCGSTDTCSVSCTASVEFVMGGGCAMSGAGAVNDSFPNSNGWLCNAVTGPITVEAYVICCQY